ncbi:MAG TPA: hypothetical protein PK705_06610, partial [Clostridia bacterium]|nr:hypothetical protein [Clostridia bacterium]
DDKSESDDESDDKSESDDESDDKSESDDESDDKSESDDESDDEEKSKEKSNATDTSFEDNQPESEEQEKLKNLLNDTASSYDELLSNDPLVIPSADEFISHDFKPTDFNGSTIMMMKPAFENTNLGLKLSRVGHITYRQVVQKHHKTIAETMQFLSLKLQNRTRIRSLDRQLEGDLDQKNLTDIFTSKENPRAFYKNIRVMQPDSTLHLLIDVSGSMGQREFQTAIVNAIILFEICKRMNIQIGVYLFSSFVSCIDARKNKPMTQTTLRKLFPYHYKNFNLSSDGMHIKNIYSIDGETNGMVFVIKEPAEKIDQTHYKMLGSLFVAKPRRISQGTPEFESFISVVKNYNMPGKNIMFILNDGGYDASFINNLIVKEDVDDFMSCSHFPRHSRAAEKFLSDFTEISMSMDAKLNIFQECYKYGYTNVTEAMIDEVISSYMEVYSAVMDLDRGLYDETIGQVKVNSYMSNGKEMVDIQAVNSGEPAIARAYWKIHSIVQELLSSKYSKSNVVYRSVIEHARKTMGWKVFGIGIRSAIGKKYIGYNNFIYIEDANEIETLFSRRLKQIY